MDIFFQDPTEIPLPPAEVRILEFRVTPYPDKRRVRVYLEVSPFQKRPNVDVSVLDPGGITVAEVSIIELMTRKMEFTIHLRIPKPEGPYSLQAVLYYKLEQSDPEEGENDRTSEKLVVDQRQQVFLVPSDPEEYLPGDEPPTVENPDQV